MNPKCILFFLLLFVLVSCTDYKRENSSLSNNADNQENVDNQDLNDSVPDEDTDTIEFVHVDDYLVATLPELDIESNKYLKVMVSDAINRRKVDYKRKYVTVNKEDFDPDLGSMTRNSILVRVISDSYFTNKYDEGSKSMVKENFNGYFYMDSVLVLTNTDNPLKLRLKHNGQNKTFKFLDIPPTKYEGDKIFYGCRYHIKEDSIFYYNPYGPGGPLTMDDRELIAYRKLRPLVYRNP